MKKIYLVHAFVCFSKPLKSIFLNRTTQLLYSLDIMHHDAHIHCLDVYNVFNDFVFVGINFVEFTLKKGLI